MAVLQMQKISICGLNSERKSILEKLQSLGMIEIKQSNPEEDGVFRKVDTRKDIGAFEKNIRIIDNAISVLDKYAPVEGGIFSSLEGKKQISRKDFDKSTDKAEDFMDEAEQLIQWSKEISEKKAQILRMENQIEAISPWLALDVPMNTKGTDKTELLLGTLPAEMTLEGVISLITEKVENITAVDCNIISVDQDYAYVAIVCLKDERAEIENVLRVNRFTRLQSTEAKTPRESTDSLTKEIQGIEGEISELEEKIKGKSSIRGNLEVIGDYYRMRSAKYYVIGELPQSKNTFILTGYIPVKYSDALISIIEKDYDCGIFLDDISEEDDPPTILTNNRFSESMEGVVEAYGLPHKGEFDPTTIMSFFYVFFFGLMLSDAAYGAIIALVCFGVLKKFPGMSKGMHKNIKMFMFCGLSTVFWGVMFGGYFGDVIQVVARTFFNKEVTVPALWFEPLSDPMKLLLWCMGFGILHLFVGLGIKGYQHIKEKSYLDFFCDVVLWYIFLIGLILMLLPTDIFASISQMNIVFSPGLNMLAKGMAITGVAGLLLMSGREQKNPALRLALGAYDIYNITGWLSDVLSYSRLLALGLATGVIASVVNQMGSMLGGGIVSAILFTIIFIAGHILNMAINILGAYVHTNRLQFVEFFGKFYEGGGRTFEPFVRNTEYIDLKEEL